MLKKVLSLVNWTAYGWEDKESHPPEPKRYLIYRKGAGKMHFEKWNGSGWASSNNEPLYWCDPEIPVSHKNQAITNL